MLNYNEIDAYYNEKLNDVPKFFAFGEKQFEEAKEKYYKKHPEYKEEQIYQLVGGCFLSESAFNNYVELSHEATSKVRELFLKDTKEFEEAFYQELWNHEAYYSEDYETVLNAIRLDYDFISDNSNILEAYEKTINKYERKMDELGY